MSIKILTEASKEPKQDPQKSSLVGEVAESEEARNKEFPEQEPAEEVRKSKPVGIQAGKVGKFSIVRSELNLERNSIFTVSTYRKKSRETVAKEIGPDGEIREHRAIIGKTAAGIETGVLTTHHFKVYLALLELWEKADKPVSEPVSFTTLRIMKRLAMKDSGEEYKRLKRWLRDLRQIPVTFINSFYLPEVSKHTDIADLTILGYLNIYEGEKVGKQQQTRGYGGFRFDDHILRNLLNNHTHPLRLDVINSFSKHRDLSILLYTYIDRNLAFKDRYEIGLEKLFGHLDLSQKQIRYPSDRKVKLKPVLEQLRGKELSTGILSSAQIHETADRRDYKLVCCKESFSKKLKEQEASSQSQSGLALWDRIELPKIEAGRSESTKCKSELLALLIEKRLTQKQATGLIAEKSPEVISEQLTYLPFRLKEYKAQGKEINEPAILYDSISDNWQAPKGYLGAEKEKEREAERLERERIARLEQKEQDRVEQERAKMEAYKETLDPEKRTKLRERALEEIRGMEGINEQFISAPLIAGKENEILKAEMGVES